MASNALAALLEAVKEVGALQKANPSPSATSPFSRPEIKRAIGRSQVVLLSSHYERYFYDLNEEACTFLLDQAVGADALPTLVRLAHSKAPVEALVERDWVHREKALRAFAIEEAPLWVGGATPTLLEHGRLLEWMKAPTCKNVTRYFGQWGIDNIFAQVTRSNATRTDLWLRLNGLVEKRNNIAHGDLTVEATHLDVARYLSAVKKFVPRVDRRFAKAISKVAASPLPW